MTDDHTPSEGSDDPPEGTFDVENCPERQPVDIDTETPRAIPFYAITAAVDSAGPDDEYVVVRSDNDVWTAETLQEADELAEEARSQTEVVSDIPHTVQVIELQEVPPVA